MAYKINEECVKCCACIMQRVCPEEAIIEGDEFCRIDPDKCTDCGICYDKEEYFCPMRAIIKVKTPSSQGRRKDSKRKKQPQK